MTTIKVPQSKFDEMAAVDNLKSVVEKETVKGTVYWQNKEYVPCSAIGKGDGTGWASIGCYQAIDIELYKGDLKPLDYHSHFLEVDGKKRERSYVGMKVRFGRRTLVFTEGVSFEPMPVAAQSKLDF